MIGDFNIDLLKYQQHNLTSDFLDTMFSHFFLPLINRPTRITSHTATLIDHIFTNGPIMHNQLVNGIFFADISDHLPILTLQPPQTNVNPEPLNLVRCDINSRTKENFRTKLSEYNWDTVYNCNDPNSAYKKFISSYKSIYNKCFPLKKISCKKAKLINPGFLKG